MYAISEHQIDFILNDIKKNGIELEDLQLNLLDHVCCIIENELEANGDFEQFYFSTIKTFYKKSLVEIEDETISLVNNKNYYVMKKVMIVSGIISTALFSVGIAFKYLHWPGASVLIVLGISILSLLFLPLLLTLKVKEKQNTKDKVLLTLGTLAAIMMVFSILFRIMHWPGAIILGYLSMGVLLLIYLPIHLTFGLRNPDTKINTIVTTVLLVTGCCLWFTMVITPRSSRMQELRNAQIVMRNLKLVEQEQQQVDEQNKIKAISVPLIQQGKQINALCKSMVSSLIKYNTGYSTTDAAFKNKEAGVQDLYFNDYLNDTPGAENQLNELRQLASQYNLNQMTTTGGKLLSLPVTENILDTSNLKMQDRVMQAFTDFYQIQMFVLQNERALQSAKPMTASLQTTGAN